MTAGPRAAAWCMAAIGLAATSAGLWGLWGWPASALFLGAALLIGGVLVAAALGAAAAGKGGR